MKQEILRAIPAFVLLSLAPFTSIAAPAVGPGQTYQFSHADGGGTQCRTATGILPDTTTCGSLTTFSASDNFVRAVFDATLLITGLGEAHYSTAWVHNDFLIPGEATNIVDAQISVTFDYYGILFAAGAFKSSGTLTLEIEDRTANRLVSSTTLFQQERDGDQGFTDIAIAQQLEFPRGETASVQVKLQRGHSYRIKFSLETLAEEFAVGKIVASGSASWEKLYVVVSPDESEQLRNHDAEVKAAQLDLDRFEALLKANAGSVKQRDDAQARLDTAKARQRAAQDRVRSAREAQARFEAGTRPEEIQAARARVEAADAQIAVLEKSQRDANVLSPISGLVTQKLVDAGEIVARGTPLVVITDLDHAWANLFVPEPTIPRVMLGQAATVFTDAGGPGIDGKVTFISPRAEFTPRNVQTAEERSKLVYRIKVSVDNRQGILKLGMPVDAELKLQ